MMSIIKNEINMQSFFKYILCVCHSLWVLLNSYFFTDLVVPKLIHMVWVGSSLPLEYYKGPLSAVQYNPGIVLYKPNAQNLRQVSLCKSVLEPGFHKWGQTVLWISIFLLWNIILFSFLILCILKYFRISFIQIYTNLKPQKVNSGVSFNDIL